MYSLLRSSLRPAVYNTTAEATVTVKDLTPVVGLVLEPAIIAVKGPPLGKLIDELTVQMREVLKEASAKVVL